MSQPRPDYPQNPNVVWEDDDHGIIIAGLAHLPLPEVISYHRYTSEKEAIIAYLQRPHN
jgi:hypothetical protein